MKIKYYVITKINGDNSHTPMAYKKGDKIIVHTDVDNTLDLKGIPKEDWLLGSVRLNVFRLGELIVIDDDIGREGDWGRAPRKWDVEWKEFDDVEKAMRFSNRLIKKIIEA